jgi:hypothetical protein
MLVYLKYKQSSLKAFNKLYTEVLHALHIILLVRNMGFIIKHLERRVKFITSHEIVGWNKD